MWQRRIELKVMDRDTNGVLLSTSENRIDFVYEGKISWMADQLKIDVYNLDPSAVKLLLDTKNRTVNMRVGYEDEPTRMATLLDGYVVNVAGRKAMPHHITSLWCIPHAAQVLSLNASLNTLTLKQGTLRQQIVSICKYAGYSSPPRFFGMTEEQLNTVVPGYVFKGNVTSSLTELGEQFRFYVKGTQSEVQIISMLTTNTALESIKADKISYHTMSLDKLKGAPQATVAMLDFVMNLDPAIDAGDIVNVTEFMGKKTKSGAPQDSVISVNNAGSVLFYDQTLWAQTVFEEYQVLFVQHVGSNYAPAWETRITGVKYNPGLAGNKDVSGNGSGTGTWPMDASKEASQPKGVPNISQTFHADRNISEREAKALSKVQFTPDQEQAIERMAGGNKDKANFARDVLRLENRGNDHVMNAVSPKGAAGPFQIMPETGRGLGMTINDKQDDRYDFEKSNSAFSKLYDELYQRHAGNREAMLASYNAGPSVGDKVELGDTNDIPKQTQDYIRLARGLDEERGG